LKKKGLGLYGSQVSTSTFPLPSVGPKLLRLAVDLHRGKGFGVIRGLNTDEFSKEDNIIIFLGLSSYIAERRGRQDEDGNMLSKLYYSPSPTWKKKKEKKRKRKRNSKSILTFGWPVHPLNRVSLTLGWGSAYS
jgi:hypothetical protein